MLQNINEIPEAYLPPFRFKKPNIWNYPVIINIPHAVSYYDERFIQETCRIKEELRVLEYPFVNDFFHILAIEMYNFLFCISNTQRRQKLIP